MPDIVIYGGSFAGVAAAIKAAAGAPTKSILLIVTDPVNKLGGIGTVGGMNFFDRRQWKGRNGITHDPQRGSFAGWLSQHGQFYNTDAMSEQLLRDLRIYSNVAILFSYDVESFKLLYNPTRLAQLNLRSIYRDPLGLIRWGSRTQSVIGTVFIDASEDGRLTRLTADSTTIGRYDWPALELDADERSPGGRARQQAATLMFKVTGVAYGTPGDTYWGVDSDGTQGAVGGVVTYKNNALIKNFNDTYGPQGYAIKPFNAAQNGSGSNEWWINALLIFNVDGRAYFRDRGTLRYPVNKRRDYKDVDQAWAGARDLIKRSSALLNALRQFAGFQNISYVTDRLGRPVVGEVLYLRETIHTAINALNRTNGTENTNYRLTANAAINAGDSPVTGADTLNYGSRIGLNYYWLDINAYKFSDLKDANGNYIWGSEITGKLRPLLGFAPNAPANPVYIPYKTLVTNYMANLLIPGYAASCASLAWSEMRTIPNLCVLGDAAGVAAAYAINNRIQPLYFKSADITAIQRILVIGANALLDKW